MAIVWACEQFRVYLLGKHFILNSDHNPLVYLDNTKNKSSRVTRWRLSLAEFDKQIVYKKGSENTNADALSRIEVETNREENKALEVINCVSADHPSQLENIKEEQRKDVKLSTIIEKSLASKDSVYTLVDDKLYKVKKANKKVLMIPTSLVEVALSTCHNDMGGGHLGFKKTWPKIRDRFFWKTMYRDTVMWLKACTVCAKRKTPEVTKIPLNPINEADIPFDMMWTVF